MSEWQPIETAPRDGTEILVCDAGDQDGLIDIVACFDGFWVMNGDLAVELGDFTHWMPLPELPKGDAG